MYDRRIICSIPVLLVAKRDEKSFANIQNADMAVFWILFPFEIIYACFECNFHFVGGGRRTNDEENFAGNK